MCLETAQLLAGAILSCGGVATYKLTHKNHPCSIWVRKSKGNYKWALEHFNALLSEYNNRFGKVHACSKFIAEFETGLNNIPNGERTDFVNCAANKSLGVSYKDINDTCIAYQLYLGDRWNGDVRQPTWYGVA
jgi:hypothetical protein